MGHFANQISNKINGLFSEESKHMFSQSIWPSLKVVILMIIVAGIAYPLLLVIIGEITLPFQSNGSLLTLDGKVIGSKLIAQQFNSDKFFHVGPAANSTSAVDPHITPEAAFLQVPRISDATGLQQNLLRTAIQLNIERNKISNMVVFSPQYVNVLEVNLGLITGYPEVYPEFTKSVKTNTSTVR
jgi:potassium-transporting ATPase KdpC subunit